MSLESCQTFDKEERELSTGLGYVFEALQDQRQLYLYLADAYMKADTPYKINAGQILERLFEIRTVTEVKELITRYKYEQQNVWQWYFFAFMPEQFPIVRYKLSLGMLAAVIAVFFDMAAFPYASPDSYLDDDWRKTPDADRLHTADFPIARGCGFLFAVACLRRIAVVAVFVLAVSLGL